MEDERTLVILGSGTDGTLLNLSSEEGEKIKHLIHMNTGLNFQLYARQQGIHPTNAYAYLSGSKPVSIRTLNKLLPQCLSLSTTVQLTVKFGQNALGADYIKIEKRSSPIDSEEPENEEDNNPYLEF